MGAADDGCLGGVVEVFEGEEVGFVEVGGTYRPAVVANTHRFIVLRHQQTRCVVQLGGGLWHG